MSKIEICLTGGPKVLDFESCHMKVRVTGHHVELVKMFAALLASHPDFFAICLDAIVNMDKVNSVTKMSDQ